MPSQLVVGDLGQVLFQLLDHQFGGGLAQCVLELCDDARGSNEHKLIEFPIFELSGKLGRHGADKVVLGGLVQIAAGLDRVTGGVALSLTRAGRSRPSSWVLLCSSVETKLDSVRKAPSSSRATKRARPPSAMTYHSFALFMIWLPFKGCWRSERFRARDRKRHRHGRRAADPSRSTERGTNSSPANREG